MNQTVYRALLILLGLGFAVFFSATIIPELIVDFDVIGAFAAGFVNPFSTGYSVDVFACWAVLAVWVVYEAKTFGVKRGWIALLLGIVPGVATGFALYLLIRMPQVRTERNS